MEERQGDAGICIYVDNTRRKKNDNFLHNSIIKGWQQHKQGTINVLHYSIITVKGMVANMLVTLLNCKHMQ